MDMTVPVLPTTTQEPAQYQLKELSLKHRQVVALIAQGVPRKLIAEAVGFTEEYISWLLRQPLVKDAFKAIEEIADTRLVALAEKRTDAIEDVLVNGAPEDKLKAARLQMEATGKVGRFRSEGDDGDGTDDRLGKLAERLVGLLRTSKTAVYEGTAKEVIDVD